MKHIIGAEQPIVLLERVMKPQWCLPLLPVRDLCRIQPRLTSNSEY